MCGIAGWIGHLAGDEQALATKLADALHHRGPDAQGIRAFPGAMLVHTRLSIIDLSELGAQPMCNEDGTVWTIFNGELYNHHGIRSDLERKGHRFRGRSDTEIIPHLYEEMGAAFVEHVRGMFAIAVYDTKHKKLVLARDRFGIKPLFYAPGERSLAFTSEIRALRALPNIDTRPNRQAIFDYAALFYIPAPETIYQGIYALQPGELIEADLIDDQVHWRVYQYHCWDTAPDLSLTLEQAAECTDELLQEAVRQQLESDVPLGSLLSGGIDSSLVSTYAQRALSDKLLTFNVRFSEEQYDETWAAVAVAEHIGSQHRTLDMDDHRGSWEYITSALLHTGQPYADTSLFAANLVCQAMRRHVTVALSGDGGDEGFGGYALYGRAPVFARIGHIPRSMRQFGLQLASVLAMPLARAGIGLRRQFPYRMRELAEARDYIDLVQTLFVWIRPKEHRQLCRDTNLLPVRRLFEPQWTHHIPKTASEVERISALMTEVNTRVTLPNDYLFKIDNASMRHSLEVRVPMLDEGVFAFGMRLPHYLKIQDGVGKRVLRKVAIRRLPEKVANKPKWGFGIPVDRWADADFKQKLRETLLGPNSVLPEYFVPESYTPMIEAFCDGRTHRSISRMGIYQRAIMLLSLHLNLASSS